MASDLVTHTVEQCYVIKFLVKEKVKPAEILHRLCAQYGEKTLSYASVCDCYNEFSEGHKEIRGTAVSWKTHDKCVLGLRSDLC
jgi:hypothetical protein